MEQDSFSRQAGLHVLLDNYDISSCARLIPAEDARTCWGANGLGFLFANDHADRPDQLIFKDA